MVTDGDTTKLEESETYSQPVSLPTHTQTTNDESSILFPKQSIPFIDRSGFPRRPLTPKMQITVEAPYPFAAADAAMLISPPVMSKSTKSVESEDRRLSSKSGGQSESTIGRQPRPRERQNLGGAAVDSLFSPQSATPEPVAAPNMSPHSLSTADPVRRLSETTKSPFHVQIPAISLQRISSSEGAHAASEGGGDDRRNNQRMRSRSKERRNGNAKKGRNPGIQMRRQRQRPKSTHAGGRNRDQKKHQLDTAFHEYSLDETDLFAKLAKIGNKQRFGMQEKH